MPLSSVNPLGSSFNPFAASTQAILNEIGEAAGRFEEIEEQINRIIRHTAPLVRPVGSQRIHLSRITGIIHDPDPDGIPKYKAISIETSGLDVGDDSRITVPKDSSSGGAYDSNLDTSYVTPLTRPVPDTHNVEDAIAGSGGGPAGLGELCFIVIDSDNNDPPGMFHGLMLWEAAKTQLCPSVPGAQGKGVSQPLPGSLEERLADHHEDQRRSWG